jgi:hypothetical protein
MCGIFLKACRKVRNSLRSDNRTLRQNEKPHALTASNSLQMSQKTESAGAERTHRGLRKILNLEKIKAKDKKQEIKNKR